MLDVGCLHAATFMVKETRSNIGTSDRASLHHPVNFGLPRARVPGLSGDEFLPQDRDLPGGLDPDADQVAPDHRHRDADVLPDDDPLADFSAQDQHGETSSLRGSASPTEEIALDPGGPVTP